MARPRHVPEIFDELKLASVPVEGKNNPMSVSEDDQVVAEHTHDQLAAENTHEDCTCKGIKSSNSDDEGAFMFFFEMLLEEPVSRRNRNKRRGNKHRHRRRHRRRSRGTRRDGGKTGISAEDLLFNSTLLPSLLKAIK